ncbi:MULTISPECIES: SRPBCC domain-containing protein [unclassified Mesorhizobium]|uniref:SRPBCC domain-containing protein n=1 Tax=unclassified Mesorhizobium TaxID=325217 RepID=UPI000FCA696C|nr:MULTISPECIES: SRPBCC domain-containing protein [unclassified Mesorhizobium]RUX97228.1 ATPase [Mesorhizobium sp. M7D.F.Ca.US.004.01.2.1]RVA28395.1 ATPase [Mesorhizobium sp. M7D.F.Ca.US.004.03.1.1]
MSNKFVYVTYIRTTPEELWEALTEPEFHQQYFLGAQMQSEWRKGSAWKIVYPDGRVTDSGEILEIDPPRRIVIKWRNEFMPEVKADGYTTCTFVIEQERDMMKLAVTHEADGPHKLLEHIGNGWPLVLSSLKSLLETGKGLSRPASKG